MKIKIRYLKLSGAYNKNGKEVPNKELEKLIFKQKHHATIVEIYTK